MKFMKPDNELKNETQINKPRGSRR